MSCLTEEKRLTYYSCFLKKGLYRGHEYYLFSIVKKLYKCNCHHRLLQHCATPKQVFRPCSKVYDEIVESKRHLTS